MNIIYTGSNWDYWFGRVRDVLAGIGLISCVVLAGFLWAKYI